MTRDPNNPYDDKALGLAMLGSVFFGAVTGLGVGATVQAPLAGGLGGGALGVVVGVVLIPALMRDWRD